MPFYKDAFDRHGVHPDDLLNLEDLAKFPFTQKHNLRDNYPFGMFAVPREQVPCFVGAARAAGRATRLTQDSAFVIVRNAVRAATWTNGLWVHEFRRALVTGGIRDDVQFDDLSKEYAFFIAVFDNCGRGEIPPGHNTYGDGQYQVLRFMP